jgi:uncharacterized repeat protein (TIGR01451 family)
MLFLVGFFYLGLGDFDNVDHCADPSAASLILLRRRTMNKLQQLLLMRRFMNRWVSAQGVKKTMLLELLLAVVIAPAFAVADPNIQLDMQVKKELIVEENGQEVTQWIDADEVLPGEKLKYTVRYVNMGDEPATQVRIENPIPALSVYVTDSASGLGSIIVFSADGGAKYDPADQVTYEVAVFGGGIDQRIAKPERFTNIRWLIEQVPPGSEGEVSFQVLVQ